MAEAYLRVADFEDENGEAKIDVKVELNPEPKTDEDMTPAQRYMMALVNSIEVVKDKSGEKE